DGIRDFHVTGVQTCALPISRSQIWQAQTPQGFPLDALLRCHERAQSAGWSVTDDAELFERCGLPVVLIEGDRENIKITRPEDLRSEERRVGKERRVRWWRDQ